MKIKPLLCYLILLCVGFSVNAQTNLLQEQKSTPHTFSCGYDALQNHMKSTSINVQQSKTSNRNDCSIVKVYYVIPSDATHRDRAQICMRALEHVHQNWSNSGRTFNYTDIQIVETPHTQNWWLTNTNNDANDGLQDWEYLSNLEYYLSRNTDYNHNDISNRAIAFIEMEGAGAAWGSTGGMCTLPEWAISGAERQLAQGGNMPDVGAIGHELGHTFGMPHRQCNQECGPRSVMCNGYDADCSGSRTSYPNVALSQADLSNLDNYPDFFPELSACANTLSVNELDFRENIQLFPNPVENELNIALTHATSNNAITVEFYSINGKKLRDAITVTESTNMTLPTLSSKTIFFVKVSNESFSQVFKMYKK